LDKKCRCDPQLRFKPSKQLGAFQRAVKIVAEQ